MPQTFTGYKRLQEVLVVLVAAGALYGCALPQKAERYHFGVEDFASGVRYAGKMENPFDEIKVNLKSASPFQFRFPDGYWANSRDITREVLIQHGVISDKNLNSRYVAWHPSLPIVASVVGRYQYFAFSMDKEGNPYQLELGACGYSFDQILRTMDGLRTYGFPMTVEQATELFGKPSNIEVFEILTGFTCL